MILGAKPIVAAGGASLVLSDMNAIPMPNRSFDVITGGYALRNSPDLAATFSEVRRALKRGGQAAFLDFSKSPNAFMSKLQIFLLKFWGGLWGLLFHGNPAVYTYIGDSLAAFPDRQKLHAMCQEAGIPVVRSRLLFFGFIEIVLCGKADEHI